MTQLALRPIGPNDYRVVERGKPIGRIYVLEGGTRKIRMLTALPKAPPPKD